MDKDTVKTSYNLISLVERDTTLRKVGAYHIGPCPFCGGHDRFTLKHSDGGWLWHCRKCGDNKYQDAIAYVMQQDNIPFAKALRSMGGTPNSTKCVPKPKDTRNKLVIEIPAKEWQETAWRFVEQSSAMLMADVHGEEGRKYLQSRGLFPADWYRELLGFAKVKDPKAGVHRPTIVIPHFDNCWKVIAVKLRFVDDNPQGLRYSARKGSKLLFWGLHTWFDMQSILVLVEGELNAISIRQCYPDGISVVSFGGENLGAAQKALLLALATQFQKVIVLTDKAEKAREVQKAINMRCVLLKSPNGHDANDLLQAGVLADFLKAIGAEP